MKQMELIEKPGVVYALRNKATALFDYVGSTSRLLHVRMHGHFTSNKSPFFRKQSDYDVIALRQIDEEERRTGGRRNENDHLNASIGAGKA